MQKKVLSAILTTAMALSLVQGMSTKVLAAEKNTQIWVDPVNGSDSNSGTSEGAAFQTIQKAKCAAAELSAESDVVVN